MQVIAVSPLRSAISGTWLDRSGLDHALDIVVNTSDTGGRRPVVLSVDSGGAQEALPYGTRFGADPVGTVTAPGGP